MRWEEKQILQKARQQGLEFQGLALKDIVWTFPSQYPPEALFLVRCPGFFSACRVADMLERMGHQTVNRFEHIHCFGQKSITDRILFHNGFPVIPSLAVFSLDQLDQIENCIAYPMICKPCIGGFGRLVHKIESRSQLIHVWNCIEEFAPTHHKMFYLQPFISAAHDIRVILMGGEVVCVMERVNVGSFKKNIAQGGHGRPYQLDQIQQELIRRLGGWLPYGFFGVDLLQDQSGHNYVCEINAVCTFKEAIQTTGVDVAGHMVNYLATLYQERNSCKNAGQ